MNRLLALTVLLLISTRAPGQSPFDPAAVDAYAQKLLADWFDKYLAKKAEK